MILVRGPHVFVAEQGQIRRTLPRCGGHIPRQLMIGAEALAAGLEKTKTDIRVEAVFCYSIDCDP